MKLLSISAFALDFSRAEEGAEKIRKSGANFLHIDIMDGKFVPLLGLSEENTIWLLERIKLPSDLHIMVCDTQACIEHFSSLPLNSMVFHLGAESEDKTFFLLRTIREKGIRCGLAISPDISVESITPYIHSLDEVLLMSTSPGEPNAVFLPTAFERLKKLRALVDSHGVDIVLSVDGGIDKDKAIQFIQHGADKLVMGRAFFESENPSDIIEQMHNISL